VHYAKVVLLLELVVIIYESWYNQAYIFFDYRTVIADFDLSDE